MSGSVMEGAILMQGLVTGGSGFQLSAAADQESAPVQELAHA